MESSLLTPVAPPPVHFGPVWEETPGWEEGMDEADRYVLPTLTLGWHILSWIKDNLLDEEGDSFTPTAEQARFILWMYALDERGRFLFRDIVLQRLKGWGKDPLAAVLAAVEFVGPSQFSHWHQGPEDVDLGVMEGDPVGRRHPRAWVQVAAVSQTQTQNTMSMFAAMFTPLCRATHGIDIGKEIIYAYGGAARIQAVTSNPRTMEGNRPTFVILNETHHWLETNNGWEMNKVIKRNLRKSKGGRARSLSITNAYNPSESSVAQTRRETWEDQESGLAIKTGVLYDSLEAHRDAVLQLPRLKDENDIEYETDEEYETRVRDYLTQVILGVRGDAWWLEPEELVAGILDGETTISDARRFYYNQIFTVEDAWLDNDAIHAAIDPLAVAARQIDRDDAIRAGWIIRPEEEIVMFFDGSKSRDSTALVGCRISDGAVFTFGVWSPPKGAAAAKRWKAPRGEVNARVREIFTKFNVVAFFGDPSHARDDDESSEGTAYWDALIDEWHRTYKDKLLLWAVQSGHGQHSIMWDMSNPTHQIAFVKAAELFSEEIQTKDDVERFVPAFTIDGHPSLLKHLRNAKGYEHPKGYGTSLWKGSRRSSAHIDLAVAAVGARMLRRAYLNRDPDEKRKAAGKVWSYD